MIYTGLVSVTFRQLTPKEIINLVSSAELDGIEWGGDIHVVPGNPLAAREVSKMTSDAGLKVAGYGSYYKLVEDESVPFETILETAVNLNAPIIRVWAGAKGSKDADEYYWNKAVTESRRIGDIAASAGIVVSYEFHSGTLTDSAESTQKLMKDISHKAIKTHWQPALKQSEEYCINELKDVLPWLTNIHAYNWDDACNRRPLAESTDKWMNYLKAAHSNDADHFALMEFVKDDSPKVFLEDAETLNGWIRNL